MTIKIGDREFATSRPADLDACLIAATGCSAAEHSAMLGGSSVGPFQVARAIAPLLVDPVSLDALAHAIEQADMADVIAQARALLGEGAAAQPISPNAPTAPTVVLA